MVSKICKMNIISKEPALALSELFMTLIINNKQQCFHIIMTINLLQQQLINIIFYKLVVFLT